MLDNATYPPRVGKEIWCLHGWTCPGQLGFSPDLSHGCAEVPYCDNTVVGHDALDFETTRDRIVSVFFGRRLHHLLCHSAWSRLGRGQTPVRTQIASQTLSSHTRFVLVGLFCDCLWTSGGSAFAHFVAAVMFFRPNYRSPDRSTRMCGMRTWLLESFAARVATRVGLSRRSASSCKHPRSTVVCQNHDHRPVNLGLWNLLKVGGTTMRL